MLDNILIAFFTSLIAVIWIHPIIVKIAHKKNIVDNPNARKLQSTPVPVLGGVAVFFGIIIGLVFTSGEISSAPLMPIIAAMVIMLYTGTMDDIIDLTARTRFLFEIGVITLLIFTQGMLIDNFHGLWDVYAISKAAAIPLTIFATVGIINSINLIDGVNGLSSGYCILASVVFGTFFYITNNAPMVILAAVSVGSLLPFFFHNVFGKTSKMFIGDGGALVMGLIMSVFVINTLSSDISTIDGIFNPSGLIPFTLAAMVIPVADTLRVMSSRIIRGTSPFHPDKTHLHHMFIDLGFSHIGTTISILCLNFIIIASWFVAYKLGASIETQLYIVLALGVIFTFGFYNFSKRQIEKNGKFLRFLQSIGKCMNFEKKGIWSIIQKSIDKL
jgi:UDP-N-acetylmuramyl pentapeptide phosphotransferase/UDP-N-acetylglucosamine-1-phosphate transferase